MLSAAATPTDRARTIRLVLAMLTDHREAVDTVLDETANDSPAAVAALLLDLAGFAADLLARTATNPVDGLRASLADIYRAHPDTADPGTTGTTTDPEDDE